MAKASKKEATATPPLAEIGEVKEEEGQKEGGGGARRDSEVEGTAKEGEGDCGRIQGGEEGYWETPEGETRKIMRYQLKACKLKR